MFRETEEEEEEEEDDDEDQHQRHNVHWLLGNGNSSSSSSDNNKTVGNVTDGSLVQVEHVSPAAGPSKCTAESSATELARHDHSYSLNDDNNHDKDDDDDDDNLSAAPSGPSRYVAYYDAASLYPSSGKCDPDFA